MKYLLDTNICIYFFNGQFLLDEKIRFLGWKQLAISEITVAELLFGAYKSVQSERNRRRIESFAEQISVLPISESLHIFGREKARLQKLGTPIGDFDLLIGSTAITHDLILATRNTREFQRIEYINVENWVDE